MKITQATNKKARIEIIPMIDVIFFLLVFFMISSVSHQKFNSVQVSLPKTSNQPTQVPQKITLTIDIHEKIFLNQEPITLQILAESLAHHMRDIPDETLVINADQGVNYGLVMEVMDQAKRIGVRKFALLNKPHSAGAGH